MLSPRVLPLDARRLDRTREDTPAHPPQVTGANGVLPRFVRPPCLTQLGRRGCAELAVGNIGYRSHARQTCPATTPTRCSTPRLWTTRVL